MSLNEVSLTAIMIKQYLYKLKGYSGLIYSLIVAQLLGLLFSMGPRSSMSSGNGSLYVSMETYNSDTLLIFSLAWIIFIAALLTSKPYRSMEFSLVSNPITSNLSNIILLLTFSVFAGLTSTLMGVLHRLIMVFVLDSSQFIMDGLTLGISDLLLGILVSSLYLILLGAIAYLVRVIIEVNKLFAIILPTVFIGLLRAYTQFLGDLITFYTSENSLGIFTFKVLMTSIFLFGMSIALSYRREVRR
jgi:hypothetical protein